MRKASLVRFLKAAHSKVEKGWTKGCLARGQLLPLKSRSLSES